MKRRFNGAISFFQAIVMDISLLPVTTHAEVTASGLNQCAQKKADARTANKYEQKAPSDEPEATCINTFTKLITDESGKTKVDTVYMSGVGTVNINMADYGQAGSPENPWSEANPYAV